MLGRVPATFRKRAGRKLVAMPDSGPDRLHHRQGACPGIPVAPYAGDRRGRDCQRNRGKGEHRRVQCPQNSVQTFPDSRGKQRPKVSTLVRAMIRRFRWRIWGVVYGHDRNPSPPFGQPGPESCLYVRARKRQMRQRAAITAYCLTPSVVAGTAMRHKGETMPSRRGAKTNSPADPSTLAAAIQSASARLPRHPAPFHSDTLTQQGV
jgi:hypothetical protein